MANHVLYELIGMRRQAAIKGNTSLLPILEGDFDKHPLVVITHTHIHTHTQVLHSTPISSILETLSPALGDNTQLRWQQYQGNKLEFDTCTNTLHAFHTT